MGGGEEGFGRLRIRQILFFFFFIYFKWKHTFTFNITFSRSLYLIFLLSLSLCRIANKILHETNSRTIGIIKNPIDTNFQFSFVCLFVFFKNKYFYTIFINALQERLLFVVYFFIVEMQFLFLNSHFYQRISFTN